MSLQLYLVSEKPGETGDSDRLGLSVDRAQLENLVHQVAGPLVVVGAGAAQRSGYAVAAGLGNFRELLLSAEEGRSQRELSGNQSSSLVKGVCPSIWTSLYVAALGEEHLVVVILRVSTYACSSLVFLIGVAAVGIGALFILCVALGLEGDVPRSIRLGPSGCS